MKNGCYRIPLVTFDFANSTLQLTKDMIDIKKNIIEYFIVYTLVTNVLILISLYNIINIKFIC